MKPRDYIDLGYMIGQVLRQNRDPIQKAARNLRNRWQRNQAYLAWTESLPTAEAKWFDDWKRQD